MSSLVEDGPVQSGLLPRGAARPGERARRMMRWQAWAHKRRSSTRLAIRFMALIVGRPDNVCEGFTSRRPTPCPAIPLPEAAIASMTARPLGPLGHGRPSPGPDRGSTGHIFGSARRQRADERPVVDRHKAELGGGD